MHWKQLTLGKLLVLNNIFQTNILNVKRTDRNRKYKEFMKRYDEFVLPI